MKALLIDDEGLARRELRRLLTNHPEVTIVGEASNAQEARAAIDEFEPDLIFLDVQMPGEDGFELLDALDFLPEVIFTTAYDEHAIRAFEVNALDYLLKPIETDRLSEAVAKAMRLHSAQSSRGESLSLESRFFVKDGAKCWFVALREVRLFESEGNYTRIHFKNERALVGRSLTYLEERLPASGFFRADRRHIIGLGWIRALSQRPGGGIIVQIEGGHEIEMSRRRARIFRELKGL